MSLANKTNAEPIKRIHNITRKNTTKWLNRVWHDGDETIPTLDQYTDDSPWVWKAESFLSKFLPKQKSILSNK